MIEMRLDDVVINLDPKIVKKRNEIMGHTPIKQKRAKLVPVKIISREEEIERRRLMAQEISPALTKIDGTAVLDEGQSLPRGFQIKK